MIPHGTDIGSQVARRQAPLPRMVLPLRLVEVVRRSASAGPGSAADGPVMLTMLPPSTTIVASASSGLTPSNSSPPAIVVRAGLLIADHFWPVDPAALHNELGVG